MTGRALAFMANDRYLHWVKAFLESLRSKDPDLTLYCIPHGGEMGEVSSLRGTYRFEVLTDGIDRLDAFAKRLYPTALRRHRANLRKYVVLNLPVTEIAYFDIDMVMLAHPARFFGHVEAGRADLVYFATSPQWVFWPRKLDMAREMFPDLRLISAGAFLTSPRALTINNIIDTVEENLEQFLSLRRPRVYDQPVLNFILHKLGKRCRHIAELDTSVCGMASVRNSNLRWREGRIVDDTIAGDIVAVHWAGSAKSYIEWLNPRTRPMERYLGTLRRLAEERIQSSRLEQ
jgi:hypothetical protein